MPPPQKTDPPDPARDLGSPYGPQPDGADESAGGADSSPLDTEPTGERKDTADERNNRVGNNPTSPAD